MKGMALLGAAAVAVVAAALIGVATSADAKTAASTIHVIEHATTDVVSNDATPSGDSAGDILTFANDVYDAGNSKRVGRDQGYCTRIVAGKSWECIWTIFLAGGQITVEGPFYDKRGSKLAVTGGTSAFASAQGWMELKSRAGGTQYDFIYHLG
jgi:allene oxide cyclase